MDEKDRAMWRERMKEVAASLPDDWPGGNNLPCQEWTCKECPIYRSANECKYAAVAYLELEHDKDG